jgi:hypothetical protein
MLRDLLAMSANGASPSLPPVPEKVPSPSDLQPFIMRGATVIYWVNDLRPGKPPESELDGGDGSEGAQSFGKVLEILAETPVASEPGEVRSTT